MRKFLSLAAFLTCAAAMAAPVIPAEPVSEIRLQTSTGTSPGTFSQCSEIGTESEIVASLVSGKDGLTIVTHTPGKLRAGDVVCSRPFSSDRTLWTWRDDLVRGSSTGFKNTRLRLLDTNGDDIVSWDMTHVWPSQLGTDGGNEVVVFTMDTLVRRGALTPPVIQWNPQALTYGQALGAAQLNATSSVPGSFTYSPDAGTILSQGVQTLSATFTPSDPTRFLGASVSAQVTVMPATLTVAADDKTRLYGAANPPLTFTITGFVNGESSSLVTGTPAIATAATASTSVGSYPITVSGTLSAPNYTFSFVSGTLTITAAPLTVKANDKTRLYGAANPPLDGILIGLLNGDGITAAFSTTATTASDVGKYPITSTLNDPNSRLGNYDVTKTDGTLTITPAPLTVKANDKTRLYGAANPPLDGILIGLLNGDAITATFSTTATTTSDVGKYPITSTLSDPNSRLGNYDVTKTDGTLTITPAPLTVKANDKTRLYGAANPPLDGILIGLLNGDAITATFSTTATAASDVGNYPITGTLSDPNSRLHNYNVTRADGVLSVTPAPLTATAFNASKTYGSPNPALLGTLAGVVNNDAITATFVTDATTASGAGTYAIKPVLADPNGRLFNYTVNLIDGVLTINKAPLTVTADDKTMVYGDPVPALTAHFSGFVLGETAAVLTGSPLLSASVTPTSAPGAYVISISAGTLASPNYSFTFVPGTLTIIGAQTLMMNAAALVAPLQTPSLSPSDQQKLAAVLSRLGAATDNSLWTDPVRPTATGGQTVFDDAKDAVLKLTDLLGSTTDPATVATLQTAIDEVVKACRVVAWASIDDATKSNGNAKSIAKAQTDLATGDTDAAAKRYSNAVLDYRNSWKDLH